MTLLSLLILILQYNECSSGSNIGSLVTRVLQRNSANSISAPAPLIGVTQRVVAPAPVLNELREACNVGLQTSYDRFVKENVGRDKEGSWILQDKFEKIQSIFDDLKLVDDIDTYAGAAFMDTLLKPSPWPVWVNFTDTVEKTAMYEMTLLTIPAGQSHEPRRHPSGTILLYKKLFGDCQMRSMIKTREIKKEDITESMIIRLAGSSKLFESLSGAPTAVLELALYPPRRVDEGFGCESGFSEESKELVGRIDVSTSVADTLFESKTKWQERQDAVKAQAKTASSALGVTDGLSARLRASIGGLAPKLRTLIRRVLMSRQVPTAIYNALGLSHVRGLLLYGPPGTGKTLIARELSRALNATQTKIVNGPEILTKYVGESEQNLRDLFREAEEDWDKYGPDSPLHVIVFDELDSIAKARGSRADQSGIRDSTVNQLLAKLDGVRQINNILVIGLTNRKDLIDPALLRPGRLEVHIEIGLPDQQGREEILDIYFGPLVKNSFVTKDEADAWIPELARRTEGYSGAQLAGIMRDAASRAIDRWYQVSNEKLGSLSATRDVDRLSYLWSDFEGALHG